MKKNKKIIKIGLSFYKKGYIISVLFIFFSLTPSGNTGGLFIFTLTKGYDTHYGDTPEYYFSEWDLYLANRILHTVRFYHLNKILEVREALLE